MESQETKQENKEGIKDKAEDLVGHVGDYLETFYHNSLLKVTGKAIKSGSAIISSVVFAILGLFIVLFASLGLAWWVGDLVDSRPGGFFIVGGFYLLVLVILIATQKSMFLPFLRNFITRKIYEK